MFIFSLSTSAFKVDVETVYSKKIKDPVDIKVTVEYDKTDNYTVEIIGHLRFEFIGYNKTTILSHQDDEVVFKFKMKAKNDTGEGKYKINFKVFEGNNTKSHLLHTATFEIKLGEEDEEEPETCSACANIIVIPLVGATFYWGFYKNRKFKAINK
jgi:hypothetical protein